MSAADLQAILERPTWSKHVIVWVGRRTILEEKLAGIKQVELDLLAILPDDEGLPAAKDERAELLDRELSRRLPEIKPAGSDRVVLRVRNAALLAKYGVGLRHFFDWFAGSRTMTVLEIDSPRPLELPSTVLDSVKLDPHWLLSYFRPLLASSDKLLTENS